MRKKNGRPDRKALRARLLAERERILGMLPVPGEPPTERYTADEWAPLVHEEFVSSRVDSIEVEELRMVEEALGRIEGGSYGVCAGCGGVIPKARLDALPWAEMCVVCQTAEMEQQTPMLAA
ncbi:MAG: TraR/DksA family transcriptional regulator [Bryobacteraceae bacterium]